jgi:hypothetical protein
MAIICFVSLVKFPAGCVVCLCVSTHLQLEATIEKQTHTSPLISYLFVVDDGTESSRHYILPAPKLFFFSTHTYTYVWVLHLLGMYLKARVLYRT